MTTIYLDSTAVDYITKYAKEAGFDLPCDSGKPLWIRFKSISYQERYIDLSYCQEGYLIALFDMDLLEHVLKAKTVLTPSIPDEEKPIDAVGIIGCTEKRQFGIVLETIYEFISSEHGGEDADDPGDIGATGGDDEPTPDDSVRQKLVQDYETKLSKFKNGTEVERMIKQRVGQDVLRNALMEREGGRCVVTGLDIPELLIASHIKPWGDPSATDKERLCPDNVLLLAPHIDKLFDKGFISFDDDGKIIFSPQLSFHAREVLGLDEETHILRPLTEGNRKYLQFHREKVFRKGEDC